MILSSPAAFILSASLKAVSQGWIAMQVEALNSIGRAGESGIV
jgi:hypothetical protein